MPTYRFLCSDCGLAQEVVLKITEMDQKEKHPVCTCGKKMERCWITPEGGFILKGTGWFKKGGY